ncbi:MAG: DUF3810 domain-containing protein [Oscillospiraceae bacterium]|nr:DUF3810 domain-containing protein [Oscillospiraceae bacterium]
MNETIEKTERRGGALGRWFRLCPVQHCLSLLGLAVIGAYLLLRNNAAVMAAVCRGFVLPWQGFFRRLTARVPFSVGEALIVCGVLAAVAYLICTVLGLVRRPERLLRLYRLGMTGLTAFSLIYGGFCLLWGVYYYTSDFEAQSGIYGVPLSVEQLETVTRYFTDLVNRYGEQVARDEQGRFREDLDACLARSPDLYLAVERTVPCLAGDSVPAKPFFFSRCLSYIHFTGFYFPFTAEANINTDSPGCLVPSTVAHELAHQRGVAEEDEANFAAVLACLEDGDPVYCYSACLLAYIHLGNALYRADYDAWADNYARLSDVVRADLDENNAYWAQFETPVSQVSDKIYTGFLQSYGQTLGLQTYGKCIDLLVAYYYPAAAAAAEE